MTISEAGSLSKHEDEEEKGSKSSGSGSGGAEHSQHDDILETESFDSVDSEETASFIEYALPLNDCVSRTQQEQRISFVVSLWEFRATIRKQKQIIIHDSRTCEPVLSKDGKALAIKLDDEITTYDSVYFEKLNRITISKFLRKIIYRS